MFEKPENSLKVQIRKLKSLKYILNIKNNKQELSIEILQKKTDELCFKHFANLLAIHYYLFQATDGIKKYINKIKTVKDNCNLYKNYYIDYLKKIKNNKEFKDYKFYIIIHRTMEVRESVLKKNNNNINYLDNALLNYKQIQFALLFNILGEYFRPRDIMENLPQLAIWIDENKNKPIEKLMIEDCEILAGLLYGLNYEQLQTLILNKNNNEIKHIIDNIPSKFHVKNLTQTIFRLVIMNPDIINFNSHEEIIETIKNFETSNNK